MHTYKDILEDKHRILFVTAHPDDVDVFFGGILFKLNNEHKESFVLVVTNGSRGSKKENISEDKLARVRIQEQIEALQILGHNRENLLCLNYPDGEVQNRFKLIGEISEVIRRFRPELVCTHEPQGFYYSFKDTELSYVNHRDHRNTGLSTLDAVYPFSRDRSFFKQQIKKGVSPYSVTEVLFTGDYHINTKIDISDIVDKKRTALLSHKSQFTPEQVEDILSDHKEGNRFYEVGNYIRLAW